jgi:polar amino acid transport system substrate-binding protein
VAAATWTGARWRSINESLDLVFAVRDDWPEAIAIIDNGLAAMGDAERVRLQARWFLAPLTASSGTGELVLSDEERALLDRPGPIRLRIDPDWMPFESLTADGRSQGIITDLLNLTMRRLNRTTVIVPTASRSETLSAARAGRWSTVRVAAGS